MGGGVFKLTFALLISYLLLIISSIFIIEPNIIDYNLHYYNLVYLSIIYIIFYLCSQIMQPFKIYINFIKNIKYLQSILNNNLSNENIYTFTIIFTALKHKNNPNSLLGKEFQYLVDMILMESNENFKKMWEKNVTNVFPNIIREIKKGSLLRNVEARERKSRINFYYQQIHKYLLSKDPILNDSSFNKVREFVLKKYPFMFTEEIDFNRTYLHKADLFGIYLSLQLLDKVVQYKSMVAQLHDNSFNSEHILIDVHKSNIHKSTTLIDKYVKKYENLANRIALHICLLFKDKSHMVRYVNFDNEFKLLTDKFKLDIHYEKINNLIQNRQFELNFKFGFKKYYFSFLKKLEKFKQKNDCL